MEELLFEMMQDQHFDTCSVGVFDLKTKKKAFFHQDPETSPVFDLASLTKPLTLSFTALQHPELFQDEKMKWTLNHRAGLVSGGRLSQNDWKKQILSYPLGLQELDLYSDYSALRTMLELEKLSSQKLYDLCSPLWSKELWHWTQLPQGLYIPVTGIRNKQWIHGEVHDDNAFVLREQLSHAGLFASVEGVVETLINLFEKTNAFDILMKELEQTPAQRRFVLGFDRPQDLQQTLAGMGCSIKTVGHLGFTGTSFWIDLEKQLGWVMLSNATQNFWYDKHGLNQMRRSVGHAVWSGQFSLSR